jgi:hypothetical protein
MKNKKQKVLRKIPTQDPNPSSLKQKVEFQFQACDQKT